MPRRTDPRLSTELLALALLGALGALAGAYWDDVWHTTRGRDTFLAAPHLAIYGGVTLIGGVATLWLASIIWSRGLRGVRERPAALLAAVAVGATLASAPIDNAWHVAFGRDAVLWSPPHLLGIVGTYVLAAALLVEARERSGVRVICGALLIASAAFGVAEYETDVPQFSEAFYLPALTLASLFALGLIQMAAPADRWAATKAAVAHGLFIGLVALFLTALDYPTPAAPIVIGAAIALDLTRGRSMALRALAVVGGLVLAAVARRLLGGAVTLDTSELALGAAAGLAVASLMFGAARIARLPAVAATIMTLVLTLPTVAFGHDPGQGDPAGDARLSVTSSGLDVTITGELRPCGTITSGSIVTRREGRTFTEPLEVDGCGFVGAVAVDEEGRWFAYAQLETERGEIETWLPVDVARGGRQIARDSQRFAYDPPSKSASVVKGIAGAALLLVALSLVAATFLVAGRSLPRPADLQ